MEKSSLPPPKPPAQEQEEQAGPRRLTRRPVPLPSRGEPGGMDVPMRRGMSRAGVRWYLRFLEEGLGPAEARAGPGGLLERKKQPEQAPQQKKRGTSEITPQSEPDQKRRRVIATATLSRPSTSYAETASSIKVAVLPSDPEKVLSREELTAVEDAFVREMISGAEHTLIFTGIHF